MAQSRYAEAIPMAITMAAYLISRRKTIAVPHGLGWLDGIMAHCAKCTSAVAAGV